MKITVLITLLMAGAAWSFPVPASPWDSLEATDSWGFKNSLYAEGNSVYIGDPAGIQVSHDRGNSWRRPQFTQTPDVLGIHPEGRRIFMASRLQGILYSEDSGFTWRQTVWPGGGNVPYCGVFRKDSVLLAGSFYAGIRRSLDTGKTWVRAAGPSDTGVFRNFAALGSTWIAASFYDGVHLSGDDGKTWRKVATIPGTARSVNSLAVDSRRVFAVTNNLRLFLSADTCRTWRGLVLDSGILVNNVVTWKDWVIAGTQKHGILFSENSGDSWKQLGTGLRDSLGANNLAIGDGILYAATTDHALWRLELSPSGTWARKGTKGASPRWRRAGPALPWTVDGRRRREAAEAKSP